MTLVRLNNWMPELSNIMNNVFDRSPFFNENAVFATEPAINILEDKDGYWIEIAAPGLQKNDFKIEINNHLLTISSEKEELKEKEGMSFKRREFGYSSFKKSFTLPKNQVDEDHIEAAYEAGILTVKLAKKEEVKPKPARMIDIA